MAAPAHAQEAEAPVRVGAVGELVDRACERQAPDPRVGGGAYWKIRFGSALL
jgi:hypothetical protein